VSSTEETDEARGVLKGGARWAGAAGLAVLAFVSWFAWTGWGSGVAPWQFAGAAVSAAVLAVLAPRWLPGWLVALVVPVASTAAWVLVARASDDSGLWAVGAILVLAGTLLAAALLVPLGARLCKAGGPVRRRG
jgi:hypothetical protein